ncbi:MAG: sigma-70 family RNA polymerase sigma factor [Desulfomonile tiedjei]|uniref:Sigma-70 family RNA polymerase sigma factor n=1 Tax=Desulfomonile tiedjei TaxID=2358 RepID=A0A9D6V4V6_9BACT|nr:sigma-70 family RNA polymerase sigma factor [Desulfomonile tiedjei]
MALYGKSPDALLVQGCLRGSQESWNEFYTRFIGLIRNVVRKRRGLSPSDVEDITQSAFLELASALKSYVPGNSLTGFVCTVTERVLIDEFRRTKASKRDGQTEPIDHHDGDEEGATMIASNSEPQDSQMEKAELVSRLKTALEGLDPKCRELIELRYLQEMSFNEVAKIKGATENTVTVQTKRCLDKLKGVYQEREDRGIQL